MKSIICPISTESVDNTVVRLTGLTMSIGLISFFLLIPSKILIGFIALDYLIRGLPHFKSSPVSWVLRHLARGLEIQGKKIDKAPKLFAARVGFLFSFASFILAWISMPLSGCIALVLLVFTILEAVLDICVGCLVYNYLVFPFLGEK